ncbi:MAG: hypothetical protein KKC75_06755 [Nanoarchaeota archaeon]|nr:hypothetical protein [Nanoarchaeota archaeon]MBU1005583.1 hypothetical protein [Nanoarchaeota archaeon]MBU1945969.1 hypothetical protein [Nanoarchaeota archaeon]
MSIITILLFLVYTYGLGFSVTFFIKNSDNFFEKHLMRLGIGLGVFPILGIIFDLIHIPIDWKMFLIVSLAIPAYSFFTKVVKGNIPQINFKITKSDLYVLVVLLVFLFSLYTYASGAFKYPYLEDDDPWAHAVGIKYVSVEKNLRPEPGFFMYLNPYPPAYDMIMGVLHQTSPSIMWTMKFFNALIISLSILFFYFFVKEFTSSKGKALFSTFVLAMIPCYMSHFIWAISLIVPLFFVAMYCLERIKYDKKWFFAGVLVIGGISLTQPTHAIKLGVMLILYFGVKSLIEMKFNKEILFSILGGYLVSLVWWAGRWRSILGKMTGESSIGSIGGSSFNLFSFIKKALPPNSGTATRVYTFNDFFVAKTQNMINNPIGVGIVLCILVAFSLVYVLIKYKSLFNKENSWLWVSLAWFIFTFLGVNSMTFNLPIGLYAFRIWMLLAIPISILAAEGTWFLLGYADKKGMGKSLLLFVIILGIIFTSGYQKYAVNTANWPPGVGWTSMDEIQGYTWLKTLPADTKVFTFVSEEPIIGFDKYTCLWCNDEISFKKDAINKSIGEIHNWLKSKKYEYLVMSGRTYSQLEETFGKNETANLVNKKLDEISHSNLFTVAYQNQGMILFKVL